MVIEKADHQVIYLLQLEGQNWPFYYTSYATFPSQYGLKLNTDSHTSIRLLDQPPLLDVCRGKPS